MTLEIQSRQDVLVLDEQTQAKLEGIAQAAVLTAAARSDVSVFLLLCMPDEIRQINSEQRGIDAVTDVLSFPMLVLEPGQPFTYTQADIDPETREIFIGDVILCAEQAQTQAQEYGHELWREVGYLLVHAVLHLLGYDHMQEEDRQSMRAMEERIMAKVGLSREGETL